MIFIPFFFYSHRYITLTLYRCSPEQKDYENQRCFWEKHTAATRLQAIIKGLQARRRLKGRQIGRELRTLPEMGAFGGGIEYQQAKERFQKKLLND